MIIPGKPSQFLLNYYEAMDTDNFIHCWRHGDKQYELKESVIVNKDKTVTKSRYCPKCGISVPYTNPK